jgi:perosamine synthetase
MARLTKDAPISRDELMQRLLDRGISTRRGIMATHREPPYCNDRWERILPETNAVADESIILPLFHEMSEEQREFIVDVIQKI